ncbi:Clotting factor B [Armadillidium nasatum]|uniref:Clotting factor B n=1 Tax=Armadillidium nasatum TaxID=96803 RepID=A0A5N5TGL5_9CRUS|nr:Clotting factor B [Armadillidium nasatum]
MNLMLTVAGWGQTMFHSRSLSPTLRMLEVPVIPSIKCSKSIYNISPFLIPHGILKSQICAGDNDKSFCSGDSGGPLVLQVREKTSHDLCEHTVAGIVSFGPGCEKLNVYTRVSSYLDWITGYIAPKLVPKPVKHCDE